GLDLPIAGTPRQQIGECNSTRSVAILGRDYVGMKPTMTVKVGDRVKLGQLLFTDKKNPQVKYTAPGCGIVAAINRGEKRSLQSVVIELDGSDEVQFKSYPDTAPAQIPEDEVIRMLVDSGLWTALRTRPYSKVPDPATRPTAIFVNAMDSNPLAVEPAGIIQAALSDFVRGVNVLARISAEGLYVCGDKTSSALLEKAAFADNVRQETFVGPHPAGLTGTHMHFLKPVSSGRVAWSINYQDVIAVGRLISSGKLDVSRIISLAGPQVENPRLLQTRLGANLDELVAGELQPAENRIISGSVLSGRTARGAEAYLGRYHLQVSVLREGRERPFMGYMSPGVNRHSALGIYLSALFRGHRFNFSTTTNGSNRAMVPVGSYERVMPLDILPTQLLRSLIVGDIEAAQQLGALELDEEDLALCSYVCPGKYEYGPILRDNLTRIEKEG
ncbi:MAG: Na(+)-translocating NADH-quinone reductase subunit A, partial [Pseudohongiellaceae bacterium]